jgi:trk system potassium uptake protein TrkA
MTDLIGVIGLGRFGSTLAKTLYKLGHKVLALDNRLPQVESVSNHVTWAKQVEFSLDCFRESGITDCHTVIVAIGNSLQDNILVTMMMKELKIRRLIARSINSIHADVLRRIGADRVVNPEESMGVRLANQLVTSDILELIEISPDYWVHQITARPEMANKTLGQLDLRKRAEAVVIGIKRKDHLIIIPKAEEKVKEGDELVVIVRTSNLKRLEGLFK